MSSSRLRANDQHQHTFLPTCQSYYKVEQSMVGTYRLKMRRPSSQLESSGRRDQGPEGVPTADVSVRHHKANQPTPTIMGRRLGSSAFVNVRAVMEVQTQRQRLMNIADLTQQLPVSAGSFFSIASPSQQSGCHGTFDRTFLYPKDHITPQNAMSLFKPVPRPRVNSSPRACSSNAVR